MRMSVKPIRFALIVMLLLLAASACDGVTDTPAAPPDSLGLTTGMEIGVVNTTVAGLATRDSVDPDAPNGGMLVTVDDVQLGESATVSWRRTVEREVEPDEPTPAVGVGTPTPTPPTELVSESGRLVVAGMESAHAALLPLYWPTSEAGETESSGMWLSQEAFEELKSTQQTRWSPDVVTQFSNLPRSALRQIEDAAEGQDLYLTADPDFIDFETRVDGERVRFQAIRAHDDFGNEYVILDQADNPMIVKFRFNAVSTGAIGIDVGIWTLIKAVFSGYRVVEIRQ